MKRKLSSEDDAGNGKKSKPGMGQDFSGPAGPPGGAPLVQSTHVNDLYTLPVGTISKKEWERVKRRLTAVPKNEFKERMMPKHWQKRGEVPGTLYFYGETSKFYGVPTPFGFQEFGEPETDDRPPGLDIDPSVKFTGTLWTKTTGLADQEGAVSTAVSHALSKKYGGLIVSPTGTGKTNIGLGLFDQLRKKTIWIVPSVPLLHQTRARFLQFLSNVRIGTIQGPVFDVKDKDIVLATVQTLSMHKFTNDQLEQLCEFGVIIADEVHLMAAPVFHKAILVLGFVRWKFGLTATLERSDGMEQILPSVFGPVLFSMQPITSGSAFTDVQPVIFKGGQETILTKRLYGKEVPDLQGMINSLEEDELRTTLILAHLRKLILNENKKVLLFVHHVKFRDLLLEELRPDLERKGKRCIAYEQKLTPEQRQRIDSTPHDLIAGTYQIMGTGMDLGYIDALFFATPKKNVKQPVGRLRFKPGQTKRFLVIDWVDPFSSFQNQYYVRMKTYKEKGFCILPKNIIDRPKKKARVAAA